MKHKDLESIIKRHKDVAPDRATAIYMAMAQLTARGKLYILKAFKANEMPEAELVLAEEIAGVRDPLPELEPEAEPDPSDDLEAVVPDEPKGNSIKRKRSKRTVS